MALALRYPRATGPNVMVLSIPALFCRIFILIAPWGKKVIWFLVGYPLWTDEIRARFHVLLMGFLKGNLCDCGTQIWVLVRVTPVARGANVSPGDMKGGLCGSGTCMLHGWNQKLSILPVFFLLALSFFVRMSSDLVQAMTTRDLLGFRHDCCLLCSLRIQLCGNEWCISNACTHSCLMNVPV